MWQFHPHSSWRPEWGITVSTTLVNLAEDCYPWSFCQPSRSGIRKSGNPNSSRSMTTAQMGKRRLEEIPLSILLNNNKDRTTTLGEKVKYDWNLFRSENNKRTTATAMCGFFLVVVFGEEQQTPEESKKFNDCHNKADDSLQEQPGMWCKKSPEYDRTKNSG